MDNREYARKMREEAYKQNSDILKVSVDLWMQIADIIENSCDMENVTKEIRKLKTRYFEVYSEGYPEEEEFVYKDDVMNILRRYTENG